jgi:hypothetical protein
VKRAGPDALERLSPLLARLRSRPALREKRPGVFYWRSRAFLHFHEDPAGLFADVRLTDHFVRLPASTRAQQSSLLRRIDAQLSSEGS